VFGKDKAIEKLLPHYNELLKDDSAKVRLAIVAKLGTTGGIIGVEHIQSTLLPAIVDLSNDKNWRVRAEIIQHIPVLASQLDVGFFDKNLSELCMGWLADRVSAIRHTAVTNIIRLTGVYGKDWAKAKVVPRLLELKKSQQYLFRQSAISTAEALAPVVDLAVVEQTLVPLIVSLASDPVPNVRFNVAKSLERLFVKFGDAKGELKKCLKAMAADSDADVVYFSKRALAAVGGG
jgi:serine/threonine-protein phosphatase 2A regulatory subunit A